MQPPGPLVGHFWFCPPLRSAGDQPRGTRYVATRPTCGPLVILSPTLNCWGSPKAAGVM